MPTLHCGICWGAVKRPGGGAQLTRHHRKHASGLVDQPEKSHQVDLAAAHLEVIAEQRVFDARRAGESLRDATASDLSRRLGVPIGVPRQHLVAVVAGRTGRDPAAVAAVLAGPPVASDGELLDLSNELESLHREALHV